MSLYMHAPKAFTFTMYGKNDEEEGTSDQLTAVS